MKIKDILIEDAQADKYVQQFQKKKIERELRQLSGKLKGALQSVSIQFAGHFADRMIDSRNDPMISLDELESFIKKIDASDEMQQKLADAGKDGLQAVVHEIKSKINIPFMIQLLPDGPDANELPDLKLVPKTIMRKANFGTSGPKFNMENVAEGVGKIVPGVNTTVDVKVGQTEVEAKKFFGGNGKPIPLSGKSNASITESVLDVPTLSVSQLAKKHDVSISQIKAQLAKGMKVELEHTTDSNIAKEIALDHIAEFPDYYDRLEKVEEDVAGPIKTIKNIANLIRHGNKPFTMALEMMHDIISKKDTNARHGINWYADKVARQFPDGIINVRALIDAYQAQYMNERKMTKAERAKETRLKDKYDDSDMKQSMKDQYGDDWENVYYATIRKQAMGEAKDPCWKGYKQIGMKKKNGKDVPNCVPVNEHEITVEDADEIFGEFDNSLLEAEYQGRKVELNKPIRSSNGPKKFHVFVKNDKGNVVKVNFGDPNMKIKKNVPTARKSFRARHKCDQKKDKTTAGYWSCRAW